MSQNQLYRLGQTTFSITHPDSDFKAVLEELLRPCAVSGVESGSIYNACFGLTVDIHDLFKELIERHVDFLQIRAACLLSEAGQKVLLAGGPDCGKTAMAVSLVLSYRWKILSDCVALLDRKENKILDFAAPFKTKGDMANLLESIGAALPGFILHDYKPAREEYCASACEGPFDVALYLGGEFDKGFQCTSMTPYQYLRKIVPFSNLARMPDDWERFLPYVQRSKCFQFAGGALAERVEKLLQLCGESDMHPPAAATIKRASLHCK